MYEQNRGQSHRGGGSGGGRRDGGGYGGQGGGHGGGHGGHGGGHGGGRGGRGDYGGERGGDRGGERRGMPLSELDPNLTDMSRRVIGCAIEVHKALGPGFDESCYMNALKIEMDKAGLKYKLNHAFDVVYGGEKIGTAQSDLYVEDRFVVDLMARPGEIGSYERSSLRAQLRAADLELGLIINFCERRLKDGLVRVLNPDKLNAMRGDEEEYEDDDEEGGEEGAESSPGNTANFE